MALFDRLERKYPRLGIENLTVYLVIGQAIFFAASYVDPRFVDYIALVPNKVLHGEVWRLLTFAIVPPQTNVVFAFFALYLFWLFGTALEQLWGKFKYTWYLGLAYVLTIAVAFTFPELATTNLYLESTVFLAFAFLFPDYELLIYFILPVKVRWLAWLTWAMYAYNMVTGPNYVRGLIAAATCSFFVYFGRDIVDNIRNRKRRVDNRQQWERKTAPEPVKKDTMHTCSVCGATEQSDADVMFFYGDDDKCYCERHVPKD